MAGHTGPLVTVTTDWLGANEVTPWAGPRSLPLWLPMPGWAGFAARSNARARAAGLELRPLADSLRDALALVKDDERDWSAGLSDEDERDLSRAWGDETRATLLERSSFGRVWGCDLDERGVGAAEAPAAFVDSVLSMWAKSMGPHGGDVAPGHWAHANLTGAIRCSVGP